MITFVRYSKIGVGSGNDYKPEHTGKRKRQKNGGTAVDLTVPMEDYHECVRLVREYRRAHPLE